MNKQVFFYLFAALLIWLLASGCRCDDPRNPECRNFDPCLLQTEVSAAFEMNEIITTSGGDRWPLKVSTGKVHIHRTLELVALDSGEVSHQWIIGTDPRVRTEQQELLTFGNYTGMIEITHIVTGPPRLDCFPGDDGRDTVRQWVEVIPFGEDMPYFGTFRGTNLHQPDQPFSIQVYYVPLNSNQYPDMAVSNLPAGCEYLSNIRYGANGFLIMGGAGARSDFIDCWGINAGLAQLSANGDSLEIHYRYDDPDSLAAEPISYVTKESTFLGIRQ